MACVIYARLNSARIVEAKADFEVKRKDNVIVNLDGILEFALVEKVEERECESENFAVRLASPADIEQNKKIRAFEPADKIQVLELVRKNELKLKLVAVIRSFDQKKLLVMYTADERVDFRVLVRELAGAFHMRIEMRQIGDREEASFVGGCGACGQPVCCRRFLPEPKQSTIKMAKVQGQALTPTRINGICGKLMCCLQYELDQYKDMLKDMPAVGSSVSTPEGEGTVEFNDCLRELVAVRIEKELKKFPLNEVKFDKKDCGGEDIE